MFDYDNRVLTCCDGTQKDEKDASLQGMWYRGQPCWTKDTPNRVLVFRGQTVLLEKAYMECGTEDSLVGQRTLPTWSWSSVDKQYFWRNPTWRSTRDFSRSKRVRLGTPSA